jgi:hypothetical protein
MHHKGISSWPTQTDSLRSYVSTQISKRKKAASEATQTDRSERTDPNSAHMWKRTGLAQTREQSVHSSWHAIWCPSLACQSSTAAVGHLPPGMLATLRRRLHPRCTHHQRGIDAIVWPPVLASMPHRFGTCVGHPTVCDFALLSPIRCAIGKHHSW